MAKTQVKNKKVTKKPTAKKRVAKKVTSEPVANRLVLRNCNPDGSSYNGYVWNTEIGAVNTCPDWIDNHECGNGLHGWLDGSGDTSVSNYNFSTLWLVLEVENFNLLDGKVKFQSCVVVFKGSKSECAKYLYDAGIRGAIIGLTGDYPEGGDYSALISEGSRTQTAGHYSTQTAGSDSTQTAGHYSTQTAGYKSTQTAVSNSTQTAGYGSTQKAGDDSTQTAGWYSTQKARYRSTQTARDRSTQTAGYGSTQKAGSDSTQKAGDCSTQTAGNRSTQTAGNDSTQTAGNDSTQTAGNYSTITCGNNCKVTAGVGSTVTHRWHDGGYKVAMFVITEKEANKQFQYLNGQQLQEGIPTSNNIKSSFFRKIFNFLTNKR